MHTRCSVHSVFCELKWKHFRLCSQSCIPALLKWMSGWVLIRIVCSPLRIWKMCLIIPLWNVVMQIFPTLWYIHVLVEEQLQAILWLVSKPASFLVNGSTDVSNDTYRIIGCKCRIARVWHFLSEFSLHDWTNCQFFTPFWFINHLKAVVPHCRINVL